MFLREGRISGCAGYWLLVTGVRAGSIEIRVSVGIVLRRAERDPVPLRWRVSNPPDVSLICWVAFRSYVFTHDVAGGDGSVRRTLRFTFYIMS